jgi:hypothetical protein
VNIDLKRVFVPLIAIALLAVVSLQTSEALKSAGAWRKSPPGMNRPDPYAALEAEIAARSKAVELVSMRDPFQYARAPEPATPRVVRASAPVAPPPPRRPVLTAILQGDNDPRALLQYGDRDYTVKAGDQFADFQVVSIAGDQVVLARGSERLVLRRPSKGE